MNENHLSDHGKLVAIFMDNAGQTAPAVPTIPDEATRRLRAALILEEALETIKALGFDATLPNDNNIVPIITVESVVLLERFDAPNLEGIADGCADLSVVSIGTLIACGIPDAPVLMEVDLSNLRKFAVPKCCLCRKPMNRLISGEWKCCNDSCSEEKVWSVDAGPWKDPTGKVRKPRDWTPPDIAGVIKRVTAVERDRLRQAAVDAYYRGEDDSAKTASGEAR